ncbi:MAG TPA: flagellar motor stator protein MotA [Vicinamibacterales bacterium]|nr:flagellar motor stator protein MotA [Vicinamibacterales bacterium]
MLLIAGLAVVLLSVAGGFLMEGGDLLLLNQPAEFIIIGGAAVGALLVGTPLSVIKQTVAQCKRLMTPSPSRQDFGELLQMLYQLFRVIQQTGVMALESHFEDPKNSPILSRYPKVLARHAAITFLSDSVKVVIVGGIAPHDFDHLMGEDLDVLHREAMHPSGTLAKVGDALPGLGIVAAVLGVVLTMQSIDGPAAEIGEKVGAALVGTFLGILLSYGFVQPISASLEHRVNEEAQFEACMKAGMLAVYKGFPPAIAIEFARRVIPEEIRPSFEETEALCRSTRSVDSQAA